MSKSAHKVPGFTLVELMVAMSIIAVLIGLSVFGISIAQRNSRDEQRRAMVRDLAASLANYYIDNNAYPPATNSFATLNASLNVPVRGVTTSVPSGTESTVSGTRYAYGLATDGYILGAELESGTNTWFCLNSTASTICANNGIGP